MNHQRTIDSLRHGLIETDMELDTMQRLRRKDNAGDAIEKETNRMYSVPAQKASVHIPGSSSGFVYSAAMAASALQRGPIESKGSRSSQVPVVSNGNRQNLSAAVKSALDAAAALKSKHEFELAMKTPKDFSRADLSRSHVEEVDRYSSITSERRQDNNQSISASIKVRMRDEATPPRDKRVAVSSTPTAVRGEKLETSPDISSNNRSSSAPRYSRPSGIPVNSVSSGFGVGFIRSSIAASSAGVTGQGNQASPADSSTHSVRRKVKATVRKAYASSNSNI